MTIYGKTYEQFMKDSPIFNSALFGVELSSLESIEKTEK